MSFKRPQALCIAFVSALSLAICWRATAEDSEPRGRNLVSIVGYDKQAREWRLKVGDGDLFFVLNTPGRSDDNNLPILRREGPEAGITWRFAQDSTFLRFYAPPPERQALDKLRAAHGAYVTADYSTKPPRVVLTKKPTKYSRWILEEKRFAGGGYRAYIRNDNDLGKDSWLTIGAVQKTYRNVTLCAVILSFDTKTAFFVEDEPASR